MARSLSCSLILLKNHSHSVALHLSDSTTFTCVTGDESEPIK